ncbi:ASCH domain-containing protein [Pectobacterium parvum]|uniref:ASCH domain-containing protein n=1 Tax=Pectobacterium TaxID=122277 RepID=UPI00057D9B97|nr:MULTISPECIES: ASCH domain-containing protein [Pectobacterium]KHS88093.1 cytoplasmic protein [Pectobacterium parvum]UFK41431.1 ASCH domain-containing protein [Pectobacterium parvum]UVD99590.1 ASCH domain-containing protein [Pectobacterium parvum]
MSHKQGLEKYPDALRWSFGDSPELADELLQLVRAGHKTATCSSYHMFKNEETPQVGDYNIVLDGAGQPSCVIQTRSLTLVRYCDVTAEMAAKEGEGDKSLAFWQQAHQAFFERGGSFAPDMLLVFEEFELVEVF